MAAARRVGVGSDLAGRPRDSYVLATKVWGLMSDDPADRGLSATQIGGQIDASLARLQTDHIDLYQAHRFDPDVPIEDTIEAFQQVVASGKARYLGFSEWTAEHSRRRSTSLGRSCSSPPAPVLDALAGARGGAGRPVAARQGC